MPFDCCHTGKKFILIFVAAQFKMIISGFFCMLLNSTIKKTVHQINITLIAVICAYCYKMEYKWNTWIDFNPCPCTGSCNPFASANCFFSIFCTAFTILSFKHPVLWCIFQINIVQRASWFLLYIIIIRVFTKIFESFNQIGQQ